MDEPRAFGNYLRSERELRQIPLSEIAAATKIPLQTLQCLERGEWNDLPATIFVRGFIRSYARHIGLSPLDAGVRFNRVLGEMERRQQPPTEAVGDAAAVMGFGRRRFSLALFVIIILIIATITLSLIWRRGASADNRSAMLDPPAAAHIDVSAPPRTRG